jgi:serine/threonine protein phosphatase PrpC
MHQRLLEFRAATASSQGARPYQEDCTRLWCPDGSDATSGQHREVLAVLADGMGGHVSGEVASNLVCEECVQHFSTTSGDLEEKIATVVGASNASLERAIHSNARLSGMGCTLVAAYLDRDGIRWASVGDSALLLFRNDRLYRLNDNHSLGALLDKQADANLITYEEAHNSPNRHSLRSALTGSPIAITDIMHCPQSVLPADWVILSSDGLDTLTGDEIATIVGDFRDRAPADLAQELLDEVGRRAVPNQDNTSVVAVRIHATKHDRTHPGPRGEVANGADTSGRVASRDTEVIVPTIHGTLVGRVKHERPADPTVLIRQHRRVRGLGLSAATVAVVLLLVAASALLFAHMIGLTSGGDTAPSPVVKQETDPAATKWETETKREVDPAVKRDAAPAVKREAAPTSRRETAPAVKRETEREIGPVVKQEGDPGAMQEADPVAKQEVQETKGEKSKKGNGKPAAQR